jgi:hypothetical protein
MTASAWRSGSLWRTGEESYGRSGRSRSRPTKSAAAAWSSGRRAGPHRVLRLDELAQAFVEERRDRLNPRRRKPGWDRIGIAVEGGGASTVVAGPESGTRRPAAVSIGLYPLVRPGPSFLGPQLWLSRGVIINLTLPATWLQRCRVSVVL